MGMQGRTVMRQPAQCPQSPHALATIPYPQAVKTPTPLQVGRCGCEGGTSSSSKSRTTTKASVEHHYILQNTVPTITEGQGAGGFCCPHFESKWLSFSLHIFQSMLSGGIVGCPVDRTVRSVQSKLHFTVSQELLIMPSLPPQSEL